MISRTHEREFLRISFDADVSLTSSVTGRQYTTERAVYGTKQALVATSDLPMYPCCLDEPLCRQTVYSAGSYLQTHHYLLVL